MENHEHIIGLLNDYENTELITLNGLKKHINQMYHFVLWVKGNKYNDLRQREAYTLKDYCDGRKSTDLTRFEYCPICGEKIDWGKIKRGK